MAESPQFADWLAICNLKAAYCRLLDTKDWDGWAALFTEDVEVDVTGSGGTVMRGREAMVSSVRSSLSSVKTVHQVHSPEIVIDGDDARGVWAMQDRLHWENGARLTGYGQYHERYLRTPQGWRIAEQMLTRLIMEHDAAPQ